MLKYLHFFCRAVNFKGTTHRPHDGLYPFQVQSIRSRLSKSDGQKVTFLCDESGVVDSMCDCHAGARGVICIHRTVVLVVLYRVKNNVPAPEPSQSVQFHRKHLYIPKVDMSDSEDCVDDFE